MINGAAVDRYTLGHAATGVAKAALGLGLPLSVGLAVGWELVEDRLKDRWPRAFPYSSHDSIANAAGDVAGVAAGWAAWRYAPPGARPWILAGAVLVFAGLWAMRPAAAEEG